MIHAADTLEQLYQRHMNTWSDMQHHVGILRYFASQCLTVLELGMRDGVSTAAFLAGGPVVTSVDIERHDEAIAQLTWLCPDKFRFIQGDSLTVNVPPWKEWVDEKGRPIDPAYAEHDLIFFDTKHTYAHLKAELERWASKANAYMIFHDTKTFGLSGEDGSEPGLREAIEPYMSNRDWEVALDIDNCCGLMVLERTR